ncbi:MAG: hypothetical protein IPM82_07505 [Saprospiraceae bacterium]|nr:hypothetical protein [Saprospiraceae bacterium]
MKRINVWSSPRNISTAFMYSFAQRTDTTVVDEPLYAHYLSKTDSEAGHPGTEKVLIAQQNDGEAVVRDVIFGEYPTAVVLFKQMTHHLIHLDWSFMLRTENVMLIRNPREIIASYAKVIANPAIHDIGVEKQLDVFDFLTQNNRLAAVVDARELLLNPKGVLTQLCSQLGLDFEEKMLHWQPGPRPEDGVWAKYWYTNVHRSSGFEPFVEKNVTLPTQLEALAERCQPFYEKLYQAALKA